jgi:hypothetical protein
MLIPLLGIPNLMQIPNITPTKENIFVSFYILVFYWTESIEEPLVLRYLDVLCNVHLHVHIYISRDF